LDFNVNVLNGDVIENEMDRVLGVLVGLNELDALFGQRADVQRVGADIVRILGYL